MINAIYCDMDGVLINSEPLWNDCIRTVFARVGIDYTQELELACAGLSNDQGISLVLEKSPNCKETPESLAEAITAEVVRVLGIDPNPNPGVKEFLEFIKSLNVPTALVSSSPHAVINAVLDSQGWKKYFDIVISGEEVSTSKPNPAVYLEAIKRTGVEDISCSVAIEDTYAGVRAARGAGLKTYSLLSYPTEKENILSTGAILCSGLDEVVASLKPKYNEQ